MLSTSPLGLHFYLGDSAPDGLAEYLDFEIEGNMPTLYSAVAALICSGLLALVAHRFVVRDAIRRPAYPRAASALAASA